MPHPQGASVAGRGLPGPNTQAPNTQGPNTQGPNTQSPNPEGPNHQSLNSQGYQNREHLQQDQPQFGATQPRVDHPESESRQAVGGPQPGTPQPGTPQTQQFSGGVQGLVLTAKYFPLAFVFALLKPTIEVDGRPVPAQWGENSIPLSPGQHHVHVHVPYILPSKVGPADTDFAVAPQETVSLEYRPPLWTFSPGSLGEGPQPYNGRGIFLALMTVPIALAIILIVLTLFL
ncbi:MAG: hypothetical protein QM658_00125 [Gordonia sp. (in: high G+C Gram-positive bacteria)]